MRKKIDFILSRSLIVLMAVMVINVLWQVASRYLFASPSTFTDELAGFLLIWVGLLGAGYATGQGLHLAINILPEATTGKTKKALQFATDISIILFALLVMCVGGGRLVYITFDLQQLSSALQLPLGVVYLVLPLSGLIMIYYAIDNMISVRNGSD